MNNWYSIQKSINGSLRLLDEALSGPQCTAVADGPQGRSVMCQFGEHGSELDHRAVEPVTGKEVVWEVVPVVDPDMQRKAADDDRDYYGERSERFDEESGGSGDA